MMTMMTIAMMAMIMKKRQSWFENLWVWYAPSLPRFACISTTLTYIDIKLDYCLNEPAKNGRCVKKQVLHSIQLSSSPKIIGSMPIARRKSANSLMSILSVWWVARRPSTNSALSFTEQLLQPFLSSMTDYWPRQSTCHVHRFRPLRKLELQIWWLKLMFDLQPDGHLLLFSRLNPLICSCKFLSGWPSRNSTSMCPFSKKKHMILEEWLDTRRQAESTIIFGQQ